MSLMKPYCFCFISLSILLSAPFIRIRMIRLVMRLIKLIVLWCSHTFAPGLISLMKMDLQRSFHMSLLSNNSGDIFHLLFRNRVSPKIV